MDETLICIKCPHASFLDPKIELCYMTGGLYCSKLDDIVGKYEQCRLKGRAKKSPVSRKKTG